MPAIAAAEAPGSPDGPPLDATHLWQAGWDAFIAADYAAAEQRGQAALAAAPGCAAAHLLLGKVLLLRAMAQGDGGLLEQAQEHFAAAGRLQPGHKGEAARLLRLLTPSRL